MIFKSPAYIKMNCVGGAKSNDALGLLQSIMLSCLSLLKEMIKLTTYRELISLLTSKDVTVNTE